MNTLKINSVLMILVVALGITSCRQDSVTLDLGSYKMEQISSDDQKLVILWNGKGI